MIYTDIISKMKKSILFTRIFTLELTPEDHQRVSKLLTFFDSVSIKTLNCWENFLKRGNDIQFWRVAEDNVTAAQICIQIRTGDKLLCAPRLHQRRWVDH